MNESKEFIIHKKNGDVIKANPEQFAKGFINPNDEILTDTDKNYMLSILAKAGFGYADVLRNTQLIQLDKLYNAFIGEPPDKESDYLLKRWQELEGMVCKIKEEFNIPASAMPYPTSFFTESLKSMGIRPKRNDHDWWLESGLWIIKGPMGNYYQNAYNGCDKFEPFQIKGGFKMDKRNDSKHKNALCRIYDLKNAGASHIIEWNISPETKCLDDLGVKSPLNGIWWRTDKTGSLPTICRKLIKLRGFPATERFAKKMLASAIGVFGNKDCSLYDVDVARSCTRSLRNTIRLLGINVQKNSRIETEWVYANNDSVGFSGSTSDSDSEFTEIVAEELRKINPRLKIRLESVKGCHEPPAE